MYRVITLVFLFNLFLFQTNSYAQTQSLKLHAYQREVTGGMVAAGEQQGERFQHIVYVEAPINRKPVISTVYINGVSYAVSTQKVKSPVVFTLLKDNGEAEKRTLVNKTNNMVYQLTLTPDDTKLPPNSKIQSLIQNNQVVVTGVTGAGEFVLVSQKMKQLPDLLVQ